MPACCSWTLDNGLRVLLLADPSLPLVHIHLCCLGGSRLEPPERSGLAHLCEHLAFHGPTSAGESLPERIHRAGGTTLGLTFHDRTSFADTLPSQALGLGLEVAAGRLTRSADESLLAGLEVQRQILLVERLQRRERLLHETAFEVLHGLLYSAVHPYHRSPVGSEEGIGAVGRDDVLSFFADTYVPESSLLVLVGDVSRVEAERGVDRVFAPLPAANGGQLRRPQAAPVPLREGSRHFRAPDTGPQLRVYLASPVPGFGTRGWYAASLLARALAVGHSSPVWRELVERQQVAVGIRVCLDSMHEASTLALVATAAPGVPADDLEGALAESIDTVCREGIDERDLERGRKKSLCDHYAAIQTRARRAVRLACWEAFVGSLSNLDEMASPYRQLEADELNGCAASYFDPDRRALLSSLPRGVTPA